MKIYTKVSDLPLPEDTRFHKKITDWCENAPKWLDSYRQNPVQIIWDVHMDGYDPQFKNSSYLCHYHYMQSVNSSTTFTYNAFTTQTCADHASFTKFLLSDESPYRDLFKSDDVFLLVEDGGKERPILIGTTKVQDLPIALWANFLIASRLSSGWALSHVWQYLIDNGMEPREALALLPWFYFNNETVTVGTTRDSRHSDKFRPANVLQVSTPNYGDQPYNYGGAGNMTFKLLNSCKPKDLAYFTIKKGGTLNPCNRIWDANGPQLIRNIYEPTAVNQIIKERFNKDQPLDSMFVATIRQQLNEGKQLLVSIKP